MSFVAWIVVGVIAGWLAKRLMPGREPGGFLATLLIGVVGAVVGGWLFGRGTTGINLYSIVVATVGAVIFLAVWKLLVGRRTT